MQMCQNRTLIFDTIRVVLLVCPLGTQNAVPTCCICSCDPNYSANSGVER